VSTRFVQLNDGWNAEPNAPAPVAFRSGDAVILEFDLNAFRFKSFTEGDRGRLVFRRCWRYRLGSTNDEGWYLGQCRFSKIAPAWGQFYEVDGDLKLESAPNDWMAIGPEPRAPAKHFLFYLRDQTFECDADCVEPLVVLARREKGRLSCVSNDSSGC
jgi:hypothetical protein